jgi:peptide/nickel transport system substrate-binding protein
MRATVVLALVGVLAAACGPAVGPSSTPANPNVEARPTRNLSVVLRNEPFDLTDSSSGRASLAVAMFGAPLVGVERGSPYSALGSVPELNTDSWKVFPDGRMETTYRLKPGLTWHDGAPFSADDMVFAREVNVARLQLGLAIVSTGETRAIEDVLAPSSDLVVIRWRQPYADAAVPSLRPLPRHVLETALERAAADPQALGAHPYWTTEHVGLGPYRLAQWERGAFIDATAFEGYVFGRANIDRITLTWSGDPNVTVARLLAGDAQIALDGALQFEQATTLRSEWNKTGDGILILIPSETRFLGAQLRPAYAVPRANLDLRVRQASIHAIDRKALSDALLEGEGRVAETGALPYEPYFDALDRVITKYPFDLRRTEELMGQAGFAKGADGMYRSPDEGRYTPEVLGIAEGQESKETTAIADYFHQAGIDAQLRLIPAIQMQSDDELKSTYPTWRTNYGATPQKFNGPNVSTAENKWAGSNKLGWTNPENDRLTDLWAKSLDIDERRQIMVQMYKNMNDDLPLLPLYYNFTITAHASNLQGPQGTGPSTMSYASVTGYRNLHEWQLAR